ncbi:PREDICTED: histamine H2 receptor-like [Priapulus caudatus]|uniref:Histamine H2 receptor-like n=1 Tax=Priapulus caudatus TaxID=37621 RepID=A0ABM1E0X1_PRICU|nr:PREDICTED: histamine H2 receptor-like [Priapulus caudatus]
MRLSLSFIYGFQGVLSVFCLFIIATNTVVIVAVRRFKRLQNFTNWFVVNLAVTDLLVGVNVAVTFPLTTFHVERATCLVSVFLGLVHTTESVIMLLVVTVERFIAISCPMSYKLCFNPRSVRLMIAATWLYSVAVSTPTLFADTYADVGRCLSEMVVNKLALYVLFVHLIVIMVAMSSLYAHMYTVVRRRHRRRLATTTSTRRREHAARFQRWNRTAKLMLIVVVAHVVCTLPYVLNSLVLAVRGYSAAYAAGRRITMMMVFLNSAVNPWIYAYVNDEFRTAFRELLSCGRASASAVVHPEVPHSNVVRPITEVTPSSVRAAATSSATMQSAISRPSEAVGCQVAPADVASDAADDGRASVSAKTGNLLAVPVVCREISRVDATHAGCDVGCVGPPGGDDINPVDINT